MNLVLPYKSSRGLELGTLDDFAREILRCAQNDSRSVLRMTVGVVSFFAALRISRHI
jgi:hypothetical protein